VVNKFSRARHRCWPRASAKSEQSDDITLPRSRLNSSTGRSAGRCSVLNPTAAQSPRAFPQLTTINFARILAAEPGMTCYCSEGPSDSAGLGLHPRVYLAERARVSTKSEPGGPAAQVNDAFGQLCAAEIRRERSPVRGNEPQTRPGFGFSNSSVPRSACAAAPALKQRRLFAVRRDRA
jgi:hypothetical protein